MEDPVPLDGIAHGLLEYLDIDLPLDQVILGTSLHGLQGHPVILDPGKDDDRDMLREPVGLPEGVEAVAIQEVEVEKYHPYLVIGEVLQRTSQPVLDDQLVGDTPEPPDQLLHVRLIGRVVLDKQYLHSGRDSCIPWYTLLISSIPVRRAHDREGITCYNGNCSNGNEIVIGDLRGILH